MFVIQMWPKTTAGSRTSVGSKTVKISYVIPFHKDINKQYIHNIFYEFLTEYDRVITSEEFVEKVLDTFVITTNRALNVTVRPKLTEEQILAYVCNDSMDTYRSYRPSEKLETCPDYLFQIVPCKNSLCHVCLYEIREGGQLYTCGCVYHVHCLKTCYGYSYLCPVCQVDMRDPRFVRDPNVHEVMV